MKQLRLFGPPEVNLLAKLLEEKKAGVKVNYHWNGKAW